MYSCTNKKRRGKESKRNYTEKEKQKHRTRNKAKEESDERSTYVVKTR